MPACLHVPAYVLCLPACLSTDCIRFVCLPACLCYSSSVLWSVALSVCRSVARSVGRSVCLRLSVGMYACLRAWLSACRSLCLSVGLSACHSRRPSRAAPAEAAHGPPQGPSTTREAAASTRGPLTTREPAASTGTDVYPPTERPTSRQTSTQASFACVLACRPVGLSLAPSHSGSPRGDTRRGHATTAPQEPSTPREAAASTGTRRLSLPLRPWRR